MMHYFSDLAWMLYQYGNSVVVAESVLSPRMTEVYLSSLDMIE